MATTKPKTAAKKTAAKPKAVAAKKPVAKSKAAASKKPAVVKPVAAPAKTKKVVKKVVVEKKGIFDGFFAKKYDTNESVLTIFKKPSLYGALIGELVGTLLLTLVMFALSFFGIYNAAIYTFAFIAITVAVFAFSGAQLNPIITAGMMASRRVSAAVFQLYVVSCTSLHKSSAPCSHSVSLAVSTLAVATWQLTLCQPWQKLPKVPLV